MKISEVAEILHADACCGEELFDQEVHSSCGADLMSDVLAIVKDQPVLLTGLVNPQVIRTAFMMDIRCIAFVRGKKPDAGMTQLAKDNGVVLLTTQYTMYSACGRLYAGGLVV